eukprot:TRINITY_DN6881_c0_g1_i4.p1 TRINITY_DN6881_c0_g1~~TRINITY_DN6881_c0_g1_i4.p1  ORF type:complete len:717 (+),score=45.89 TRINITY_DN6881_c0_g1_i4:189-2339(+)
MSEQSKGVGQQVCVIGAGLSGLSAAKVLKDAGHKVTILEKSEKFGGVWNCTYRNVRLQQSKYDFVLNDTTWPTNTPSFPNQYRVRNYINKFVEIHDLVSLVEYNCEVLQADFDRISSKWTLWTSKDKQFICSYLVVACGALGPPRMSLVDNFRQSGFNGPVLHSSQYYDGEPFSDKRVLVIGGGSSAVEIAVDLARTAESVTMCIRGDAEWVFPRRGLFGQSLRMCGGGGYSPTWWRNLMCRMLFMLKYGNLELLNVKPRHAPLDSRIVVSDEFYDYLDHGMISIVRSDVQKVNGNHLTFIDGGRHEFDAVVTCTGFEVPSGKTIQFLSKYLQNEDLSGLYKTVFHLNVPNCGFVGYACGFVAIPKVAALQATYLSNVIDGKVSLPDQLDMHVWAEKRKAVNRGTTLRLTDNMFYRELQRSAKPEAKLTTALKLVSIVLFLIVLIVGVYFAVLSKGGSESYRLISQVLAIILFLAGCYCVPTGLRKKEQVVVLSEEEKQDHQCAVPVLQNHAFRAEKEQVEDIYDEWAETYEADSLLKLGFASPNICAAEVARILPDKGSRVLDVGCGTGLLADLLEERGLYALYIGLDMSTKMLDIAAKKGKYEQLVRQDICVYPWPVDTASVDACMCNGVLIYVDDPDCLDEFVRVTRVGGHVVLMFRHDGYPVFAEKDQSLRANGKWQLVSKTQDYRNFISVSKNDPSSQVIFNIWTFQVLKN